MTSHTPPWIVRAWPPFLWHVHSAPDLHLVHLGTRVLTTGDDEQPCCGQTLWGGRAPQGSAGVAWDWVELTCGVVAMADPLGLVTNLQLVDSQGAVLGGLEAALRLNQIVNTLPWQDEVERALQAQTEMSRH